MRRILLAALLALSTTSLAAWQADAARDTFMARSDRISTDDGYSASMIVLFDASDGCNPTLAILNSTPKQAGTTVLKTMPLFMALTVDDHAIISWPTTRTLVDGKRVIIGNDLTPGALVSLANGTTAKITFTEDPDSIAIFPLTGSRAAISEALASCIHARAAQPQVHIP
jgi:hypothetical protein